MGEFDYEYIILKPFERSPLFEDEGLNYLF